MTVLTHAGRRLVPVILWLPAGPVHRWFTEAAVRDAKRVARSTGRTLPDVLARYASSFQSQRVAS